MADLIEQNNQVFGNYYERMAKEARKKDLTI